MVGARLGGMVSGLLYGYSPPFGSRLLVIMVVAGFSPLGGDLMRMRLFLVYLYAISMKINCLCPSTRSSWRYHYIVMFPPGCYVGFFFVLCK